MTKIYKLLAVAMLFVCTLTKAQPVNGVTTFFTNTTTALVPNTACSMTKSTTVSGWLFTIQTTSNCGFNWTNTTGGDGRIQYLAGFGTLTQATFGSDDGSEFAMTDMVIGVSTSSWVSKPMTYVGYKNGLPVSGATLNANTPSGTGITNTITITFSNTPAFADVDEIRMAPNSTTCNTIYFFETITIGTASTCATNATLTVASATNVSCNGGFNGAATISASGGPPFTYTWSPSGGNSATATGLAAGIYTCSVKNMCANIVTKTVSITQPSALVTSTALTNVACNGGSNGVGAITASGGAGSYSYLWSNGATTSAITGQTAGVKTVTVTDANGCTSIKSVNITQPSALVTTTAVTTIACNGGSNGVASISASGGAGGYSYLWSNGGSTSAITGLMAGVYTATVTDANSCTSIKSAVVTQPSALVTSTAVTNVACNGGSNGVGSITASGGAGGYTYLWSNGGTTSTITGLMAGAYTATVTDANSCTSIKSAVVTQPSALVTTTAITNILCNGGNGSATITASGGTGTKTYLWSNSATTANISGLLAGVYTATVTDANSCTSIKSVNITQPSALVTTTAITTILCNGGNGNATITASGGTGTKTYLWSNSATTANISGLLAGVYTATVTDANSCTSIKSVNITQPTAIVVSVMPSAILCNGGSTSITVTATGGVPAYTGTGTFTATAGLSSFTITDANNCSVVSNVTLTQPSALMATSAASSIQCNGGISTINVSAAGGTPSYTGTGTFTMTAGVNTYTISDSNGCTTTTSVSVTQPAAIAFSQSVSICAGQSYTIASSTYSTSGIYTTTLTSLLNGCDSTITTNLTVYLPVDVSTSLNALTISANNTVATSYQWLDCNNSNQAIPGATLSVFTASNAGSYAVSITENNCTATSSCVTIVATGVKAQSNNISVSVLPNPNNGQFVIDLSLEASVEIIDALGRLIYTEKLAAGKQNISLSEAKTGIYFVKITTTNKQLIKKIVIEK